MPYFLVMDKETGEPLYWDSAIIIFNTRFAAEHFMESVVSALPDLDNFEIVNGMDDYWIERCENEKTIDLTGYTFNITDDGEEEVIVELKEEAE